jgi:predicted transcriptional regulator
MRAEILKQRMIDNDPRGRYKDATQDEKRLWHRSYDELEKLLDDDDFEDFLDTLD